MPLLAACLPHPVPHTPPPHQETSREAPANICDVRWVAVGGWGVGALAGPPEPCSGSTWAHTHQVTAESRGGGVGVGDGM